MALNYLCVDIDLPDEPNVTGLIADMPRFRDHFVSTAVVALLDGLQRLGIPLAVVRELERPKGNLFSEVIWISGIPFRVTLAYGMTVVGRDPSGDPIYDMKWIGRVDVGYEQNGAEGNR